MESNKNYVSDKRKFNDAWAFILYVLYYIGVNTWLLITVNQNSEPMGGINFKLLGILAISTLAVIAFSFLAFAFFCELTIKVSVFIFPIVQIILLIMFPNPISIIFGILSLALWGFFVYAYWSRIPTIAKVLSYTSKICFKNFFACIFGITLCSLLQVAQIILTSLALPGMDKTMSTAVIAIVFLNFFWTLANFNYFFKVYIASIVTFHFVNHGGSGSDIFTCSLGNTAYALGSISYAGLVIAVVQTLRTLLDRERMRDDRERNILTSILYFILAILLNILEDVIRFANEFSMPYIAIHGTGYVQSVKESFRLITTQSTIALGGMGLLDCALSLFSILMILTNGLIIKKTIFPDIAMNFKNEKFLNPLINTVVGVLVVYFVTMSMFISSYLSLIYLHAERHELVSSVDPDIAETLKKQA